MRFRYVLGLLSVLFACTITRAGSYTVTIHAVDADHRAVSGAGVALYWQSEKGVMTPRDDDKPLLTGADGTAQLRVDDWNRPRPVTVMSADRKLGGVVGVSNADDGKTLTVTLAPTVHVKGQLECAELKTRPTWANTTVTPDGFKGYVTQNINETATLEFILPPGKYAFGSYGTDVKRTNTDVMLASDHPEVDLGTINLKATAIAKLKGKPPPAFAATDARGVAKDVNLGDYKGRWVYIEFWGFW